MRCPDCGHSNSEELEKCEKCESLLDDSEETGIRPVPSADDSDVTGLRPAAPASSEDPASESEASTGYQPSPLPDVASRPGTPSPPMTPSPGSLSAGTTGELPAYVSFGNRYEILELLGEGGMGRVYKAWDRELEKVIALKTIRGEMSNNPELVKRFKQELLLARKITHKNVIRIHDLGESEGVRFFTMEYIPGESLKRMVERCGKIPGEEAVPLVKQMLSALEEAHSQGVIHRDLKPENIMIDPEGVLHIMDFGIARSAQDTGGMTAQGMMIGTPDYMSPEQVRAEKADAQSDLFSFGVILYEMLTGELPYQGDTAASRVMMRLSKKPPPLGELHGEIPKFLENMAVKCLEIDRELRYKSAHEVLQDIERESVDRSLALRAVRAVTQSKAGIAAAVATVLAVGATLYLVSPDKSPSVDSLEGPVTTLAILPFTNASGAEELEWMRTGLSEMLVTDISQSRYLRPVPGGRVMKVLTELGLSEQTRFDDAALQSVSQRAPAQSVLHGQFVEVGGTLRLDLTLREAGSGVPIPIKVEGASSEVFALVDQITEQVKQHLDLTAEQIREDTDRPMAEVSTGSLEALQAYQSGLAHLQRGANQAAIPLLKEATVEDPSFAMAYAKLADAYLDAGEHEEAEVAIEQAQTLSETASLPLVERYQIHAIAAQVKDDYEAALESYRELAKLYPDDPDIQLSLGLLYEGLGRFPEASEAYARSLELAPHYGEARFGLAYAQVLTGKLDEGIQLLQNTLASGEYEGDPEAMGMIHSILGLAYRETGDLDQAIEHFNQSLDFRVEAGDTKGQSTTLNNLAVVYMIQGDSQKSYQVREEALSIAREMGDLEDESHILADIGLAHEITGDLDKALTSYRESMQIEMERQDHYALANRLDRIANIYRLKGQYNDALVYLEQAGTHLAQSGDKRERSMNLSYMSLVRKAQGLYKKALEALLEALAISQEIEERAGVAEIHRYLAEIYRDQGRYGDAKESLQLSLELFLELQGGYDIAAVRSPRGHLLLDLGLLNEADAELAEAEKVARKANAQGVIPEILLGRSALARAQGKHRDAAPLSERAKEIAEEIGLNELTLASQIEQGRVYLADGKLQQAERILSRTWQQASRARLRPLEAKAGAALGRVYLAKGDAEAARDAARGVIDVAEDFSGRPTLYEAQTVLGEALQSLGREQEAVDAFAEAVSQLDWMRGSLPQEHTEVFMGKPSVQAFLKKAVPLLERAGRGDVAAPLKQWIRSAAASPETGPE